MATVPASADDGPVDFGIFQGVNNTKGSNSTDSGTTWRQTDNGGGSAVPKSPLTMLVDSLAWSGRQ
ncbi:hypothetical protein DMH25_18890 [Streptomyces sp. WAC 01325]|nr:hypothetical protein DMH25_18890 [Streptomyces sp. WAC 01325]